MRRGDAKLSLGANNGLDEKDKSYKGKRQKFGAVNDWKRQILPTP